MAALVLKFVFWALTTLANIASHMIFKGGAYFVVVAIQAIKVPGIAISTVLDHASSGVMTVFEFLLHLLLDATASLLSSCYDLLIEAITGSVGHTTSAIGELIQKTKDSLDDFSEILPEVFEGLSEMIVKIASDFLRNYKDSIGYVLENL